MPINSRTKGATAEREFAGLVHDHLGVRLVRNLQQTREGGHDLVLHPDEDGPAAAALDQLAIEVKRYQRATHASIMGFWVQACQQAEIASRQPCLAYREDRQPWRVIIPLHHLRPSQGQDYSLEQAITLSVPGFAAVIREEDYFFEKNQCFRPGNH